MSNTEKFKGIDNNPLVKLSKALGVEQGDLKENITTRVENAQQLLTDYAASFDLLSAEYLKEIPLSLLVALFNAKENAVVNATMHTIQMFQAKRLGQPEPAMPSVKMHMAKSQHRHVVFDRVKAAVDCRQHVWLAGPAGSGKTTLAAQVAEDLGLSFYSTGAVASKYDLLGFLDAHGKYQRTGFRQAFETGGVFLKDEIDASAPAALLTVNQALANDCLAFPDGMVARHKDFVCIAAANTWGHGGDRQYVGRNQIDAATLDRFVGVTMDYDEKLESALTPPAAQDWCRTVQTARRLARELQMRVVISPRATFSGTALLGKGLSYNDVLEMTIFKGMPADSVTKMKAQLNAFLPIL